MVNIIKVLKEWNLDRKQRKINREYGYYGLTDALLEEQIKLNNERHELNIPDTTELNEDGFSQ